MPRPSYWLAAAAAAAASAAALAAAIALLHLGLPSHAKLLYIPDPLPATPGPGVAGYHIPLRLALKPGAYEIHVTAHPRESAAKVVAVHPDGSNTTCRLPCTTTATTRGAFLTLDIYIIPQPGSTPPTAIEVTVAPTGGGER